MAHSITLPFFAFKLHLSEDNFLKIPLMDAQAIRLNEPLYLLAGRYAEQLQEKVLNKGEFHKLLDEYAGTEYTKDEISVSFKKSKDGISYPDFDLTFDFFYTHRLNGFWGIVPAINTEAFGDSLPDLQDQLVEAVRSNFTRNKRLKWVREILSTIWLEEIELKQDTMLLRFPNIKELEKEEENANEKWLPKVAKLIKIDKQVVYGRSKELEQVEKALKGEFNRNVLLVGASGVGKTALVWEIIRQKKKRKIKGNFWETTASLLIKELTEETGWQDNLPKVCKELTEQGDFLYVNSFMELFEVGKYVGNDVSIANYLRPFISRGEVSLITECSEEELARIELDNPNYLAVFQIIRLEEPKADLEEIIIKKVKDLATKRSIQISEEAIQETLRLNRRFTPYSGLPGKPIRFLESILINHNQRDKSTIDRSAIIRYFCEETGMPLFMVDPSIPMKVGATRDRFNTNVFGQETAVNSIVNLLSSVKTALTRIGKPIASFLFVGPTGVGKTELAKVLAEFMFGSRDKMIRFDMSEYADPYAVTRLTGLNFQSDGLLTSAVRQEPFCVLLFDEIEKAHPNFNDLLLQVLSEGRLTDSRGKLVNFCSTIIIMTSNIGAANLMGNRISLKKGTDDNEVTTHFLSAVQQYFRPELYNRIDEVIPFVPLSSDTIRYVVEREINLFKQLEGIHHRRLSLTISEEVYDYLAKEGYNPQYGARQLQRAIRELLIVPLAKQLNIEDFEDQLLISITAPDGQLVIDIETDPLGMDLMMEELDKSAQTDIASELRRTIGRLKESNAFIRLQNTIQEFERLKRRKKERLWDDQEKAKQFTNLLRLEGRLVELKEEIGQLEEQLSLAYMNIGTYHTSFDEGLKTWKKVFFDFKIDLCSHLFPNLNTTYLSIYARKDPTHLFTIYKEVLRQKKYKIAVKSIWYRPDFYNKAISIQSDNEAVQALVKDRYPTKKYIEREYGPIEENSFKAPQKKDILVGIILKIEGTCPHLLLQDESGTHLWKINPKAEDHYSIVQVSMEEVAIPDGIHKPSFYSKLSIRRRYEANRFYDKKVKKKYETNKTDFLPPLMTYLEEAFKINLEQRLQ